MLSYSQDGNARWEKYIEATDIAIAETQKEEYEKWVIELEEYNNERNSSIN